MCDNNFNLKFKGQQVLRGMDRPLSGAGNHIIVLKGNLAKQSCVMKLSGNELDLFVGSAICFDSEMDAFESIMQGQVKKGHVLVIRYEGGRQREPLYIR